MHSCLHRRTIVIESRGESPSTIKRFGKMVRNSVKSMERHRSFRSRRVHILDARRFIFHTCSPYKNTGFCNSPAKTFALWTSARQRDSRTAACTPRWADSQESRASTRRWQNREFFLAKGTKASYIDHARAHTRFRYYAVASYAL